VNGAQGVRIAGWANLVTALRLGVVVLFSLNLDLVPADYTLTLGMVCFLAGDYLDGYLARTLKEASLVGRLFDEEVDSLATMVLAVFVYDRDLLRFETMSLSALALVPGILHYLFVVVKVYFSLSWPRVEWARFSAGFCWLLGGSGFVMAPPLWQPLLCTLSVLVNIGSFAASFFLMIQAGPVDKTFKSSV
jgi:phosphatidylglycerophosphate synthase